MKTTSLAVLLSSLCVLAAAHLAPQQPAAAPAPTGARTPKVLRTVRWQHGDEPIRLLPTDVGFAFVSGMGGNFEGGGEGVRVYSDDEFWYVGGHSCQPSLWVEVTCVQWPGAAKPVERTRIR